MVVLSTTSMEKRIKYGTILLISLIIGLGLYGYFFHLYGASDGNIRRADAHITANELSGIADKNEAFFNTQYLYKVVSVRGIVREVRKNDAGYVISIGNTPSPSSVVSCIMDSIYLHRSPSLKTGDSCAIRGTCAGHLKVVVLLSGIIEK